MHACVMCMCILCLSICVNVCTYVCILCVCMYICIYVWTVCVCVCVYIWHIHTHIYNIWCIYVYVCMDIYIYIHVKFFIRFDVQYLLTFHSSLLYYNSIHWCWTANRNIYLELTQEDFLSFSQNTFVFLYICIYLANYLDYLPS